MGISSYIKRVFKLEARPKVVNPRWSENLVKVEMYSTPVCPYCIRAKALLNKKGVPFEEINVMINPTKRQEMMKRANGHTVPQIFIDGKPIGGCDEMFELDFDGDLDEMLGIA